MKPTIKTTACYSTDRGSVRLQNEDTCFVNNEEGYFLVADGIGSRAAGKMAGEFFAEAVIEGFAKQSTRTRKIAQKTVRNCFSSANAKILSHVMQVPDHSGMGCTAELIVFHEDGFTLGHIGDSRTYRLRKGEFKQLTNDHTFIQDLRNKGLIKPGEDKEHPMRNIILQAVGVDKDIDVDMIDGTVSAEDIFLLCTDGLSDMVTDTKIKEILEFKWPLDVKATMLIDQANYAGGKDNITVVLIQINES